MAIDKLTISSYGPTTRECEIYLNEVQLNRLKSLTIYMDSDSLTHAVIELAVDEVHIDAEALMEIIAYARKVTTSEG